MIKVIGKNRAEIIGVYRAGAQGGRIVPVEKRSQGREILIPPGEEVRPATATSSASPWNGRRGSVCRGAASGNAWARWAPRRR